MWRQYQHKNYLTIFRINNIKLAKKTRAKKGTYFGHKLSENNKFPIDWHQFSILLTTLRAVDDAFGITHLMTFWHTGRQIDVAQ